MRIDRSQRLPNYYDMAFKRAVYYTVLSLIVSHFRHENEGYTEWFAIVSAVGGWFYGASMYWKARATKEPKP